jgi:hypothetical protein
LNGTHQLLAYADDVNLLGERNTDNLTEASKVVNIEVNAEKTKYMLVSPDQNADQNQDIKIKKQII